MTPTPTLAVLPFREKPGISSFVVFMEKNIHMILRLWDDDFILEGDDGFQGKVVRDNGL